TVFRLQPSSLAIRFVPQPSPRNRRIVSTSSGVCTSPHEPPTRREPRAAVSRSIAPLLSEGVNFHVVGGSVFDVARYLSRARHSPSTDEAVSTSHQRQGRALHPDAAS